MRTSATNVVFRRRSSSIVSKQVRQTWRLCSHSRINRRRFFVSEIDVSGWLVAKFRNGVINLIEERRAYRVAESRGRGRSRHGKIRYSFPRRFDQLRSR